MAGYMKLSLAVVVLVAFVGICMADGGAFDDDAYDEAVEAVWGNEIKPYEETVRNLEKVKRDLTGVGCHLIFYEENQSKLVMTQIYLSACTQASWTKGVMKMLLGKAMVDDMIKDVRKKSNSANLIHFLEECKQKFHS